MRTQMFALDKLQLLVAHGLEDCSKWLIFRVNTNVLT